MNASVEQPSALKPASHRAFRPSTALAITVTFDGDMMEVHLADGRIVGVPVIWFPLLYAATEEERARCEIGAGGASLHWPSIDEDISVSGLLAGADRQSS